MEVPDNIFQLVNHFYMTLRSFVENFMSLSLFQGHQEPTRPPSMKMESRRTWRILTIFFNLSITSKWLYDHLVKIASHYTCFRAIKNPPVLQVCKWSLRGHVGSWQYFSTCQSLLNDSRIIWWKFQVITPVLRPSRTHPSSKYVDGV